MTLPGCEDLLDALRRRGVRLGLDDFGQGQTSLRHLRRFPLDVLKVDKSILHGATSDARDRAVPRPIVELATDLGLAVIGEGVETAEHVALLEALGCQMAQGFHLAGPLDAPELVALAAVPTGTG